jgi:hypothetical protein
MWHECDRRDNCTGFYWVSLKQRDHLNDRGVDGIKMNTGKLLGGRVDSVGSG